MDIKDLAKEFIPRDVLVFLDKGIREIYRKTFDDTKGALCGNRFDFLPHLRRYEVNELIARIHAAYEGAVVEELQPCRPTSFFTAARLSDLVFTPHYVPSRKLPRGSTQYTKTFARLRLEMWPDYQVNPIDPGADGYYIMVRHGVRHPVSQKPDFIDLVIPDKHCKTVISEESITTLIKEVYPQDVREAPASPILDSVTVGFKSIGGKDGEFPTGTAFGGARG